ncbi:hypothetical protein AB0K89_28745 [Streptomyces cinnamoneus]|uniref:hypothetical protein n=1 Tax=Streptomyces cinnamoneus TaxID=53446 RepID=UPI0034424204
MSETVPSGSVWKLSPKEGGALAARWWQWALSAPDDESPVRDKTGEFAGWDQPDDLWFLAGTYGGRVVRRCAIPAGRPVFFPVFNTQRPVKWFKSDPMIMEVDEARAFLNGLELPLEVFTSKPFRAAGHRRVAWGLWAGLAPLAPGQYVLEIKARTTGGFWVDTTYHLTVEGA